MSEKFDRILEIAKRQVEVPNATKPGRITTVVGSPPPPSDPKEKDGKEGESKDGG